MKTPRVRIQNNVVTNEFTTRRVAEIVQEIRDETAQRTDRMFAWLMIAEWLAAIAVAYWISPKAWAGTESSVHIHLWAALVLGGVITAFPVYLAVYHSTKAYTRHAIAVGQMLMSALLIHFTGGRLETHFHIFGSLAFLAFYRDWRVLITASAIVAGDHFLRGVYWPQSVFGVLTASHWRWIEHVVWVVFEDFFLIISVVQGGKRFVQIAENQATLEASNEVMDRTISERTFDLKQSKEAADEASRAKSEFLANMSHEIRTPMNAIVGMTDLVLDTDLTREQREYLTTVRTATDSLLNLINDILDFSKIEAGRMELERLNFSLRETLEETVRTLAVGAQRKGLELACRISPDVSEDLIGDPDRLRQLVINLVTNAIKFTNAGEVIVEVELESRAGEEVCLHFVVTDTGIGIPKDKLDLVFKAFAQADASTTRKYGGTGLGLTIAARLAGMMGGRLWAESTPGKGSRFHFTARFGMQAAGARRPAMADTARLAGVPVLIVDDNATNRRILEETVVKWEMRPTCIESGPLALEALRQASAAGQPLALVLLDVQMPGMDGFQVAEQIQKCAELEKPAILMLSSSTAPGDAGRSRELGVAALLTKPIRRKDLLEALLQVISGAQVQRVTERLPDSLSASGAERKLRILLAEDNAVNQTVAMRMLQKHRHEVVVAGNGKEVLELLRDPKRHFDLILMDIQMPEMDGFAATAAIRDSEKGTGRHIPIVAMTAHAMKGDRERCLAAGMDSYISKPIRTTELSRLLDGFTGRGGILAPPSETPPIGAEIPDMKIALENFDHDEGLLAEVIGLYLRDSPAMLAALRVSIERQEPNEVERAAHRFKGAISNFAAPEVNRVAQQLEMMGQQGDLSGTREALSRLESLLPPVHELMTRFREEQVRHANTDSGR